MQIKRLSIPVLATFLGVSAGWADIKITDAAAKQAATSKALPEYPLLARQMNLAGKVEVDLTIAADGNVESATVKSGNPILGGAAVAAVKKWKFTPFTADGKPCKATAVLQFDFTRPR